MKLLEKLLTKINGLHYAQEYLCTDIESFQQPLYLYLARDRKVIKDISKLHCFTGYSPLVFSFPSSVSSFLESSIEIIFSKKPLTENEFYNKRDAVAILKMKKIQQQGISENIASFYIGEHAKHRFISNFHQFIIHLNNSIQSKKPGNVFLKGNLLDQVQIAYAVPRKICLITVGDGDSFNLFPTDLHGQVDDQYYLISLRHQGKACKQVESSRRIVLSEMAAQAYKKVYGLGKNHMQPLKEKSAFEFSEQSSMNFHLPIPSDAVAYRELELQSSFIHGIHKLLLFKMVSHQKLTESPATLVHIHSVYATWRDNQGFRGNYLLR